MPKILRNSFVTKSWTVPIAGGFDPVTLTVDSGEGIVRLGIGHHRTGPDPEELRAIAEACIEAADAAESEGLS